MTRYAPEFCLLTFKGARKGKKTGRGYASNKRIKRKRDVTTDEDQIFENK